MGTAACLLFFQRHLGTLENETNKSLFWQDIVSAILPRLTLQEACLGEIEDKFNFHLPALAGEITIDHANAHNAALQWGGYTLNIDEGLSGSNQTHLSLTRNGTTVLGLSYSPSQYEAMPAVTKVTMNDVERTNLTDQEKLFLLGFFAEQLKYAHEQIPVVA